MKVEPFPPTVEADPRTGVMNDYWKARVAQHTADSYAGVRLSKFPEDLRVYEHLLWNDAPDTVIEIGTQAGGSALWLRDRLAALTRYGRIRRAPLVVSVDVTQELAREEIARVDSEEPEGIVLLEADVRDAATAGQVERLLAPEARCLVIEDSAHEYDTTMAALEHFARFVPPEGFFVVEDGCVDVDELRLSPDWPRGVLPALQDWLRTPAGQGFAVRRDLELYGVSCHPGGFLQRGP